MQKVYSTQLMDIWQQLCCLWLCTSIKRRRQFILMIFLYILSSFAEVLSIGAIIPFLTAIINPGHIINHPWLHPILIAVGITQPSILIVALTIFLVGAAFLSGIVRFYTTWLQARLSFEWGNELSEQAYKYSLHQPYLNHVSNNSANLMVTILDNIDRVSQSVVLSILIIISSLIVMLFIILSLILLEPSVTIFTMSGFGLIYWIATRITRHHLQRSGSAEQYNQIKLVKVLQESVGGIRDIILDGSQPFYTSLFTHSHKIKSRALGDIYIISQSPRYIVEVLGIFLLALVTFLLTQKGTIATVLPLLGALALAAQRILPLMNLIYSNWVAILGNSSIINNVTDFLIKVNTSREINNRITIINFEKSINLNKVSFRYNRDSPWVLKEFEAEIQKGQKIGIIGATGTGKSTMIDILMGLLPTEEGALLIDGIPINDKNRRAWQQHIAHVPQSIYLADTSFTENIAFGIPKEKIIIEKVKESAQKAQIAKFIESKPDGYNTLVGERGIRLSGGQRQRIAIARALYKNADVIVFDEATSALDNETELAVIDSINQLDSNLTIIMIAHRLSSLKNCDRVIDLNQFISTNNQ